MGTNRTLASVWRAGRYTLVIWLIPTSLAGKLYEWNIQLLYKLVYKFPKCQKIHYKKWTKLVKLSCIEIIDIFAFYQFRLSYCTFWVFTPISSPLFTYVHPVMPKTDGLPHGPSSSRVCCVVGCCVCDVVVMCSEYVGHWA